MNQTKAAKGAAGRYVLRHILRSPGKSLLCLALAAIFMLGLMLIRVSTIRSEDKLEELYRTTTVTVELVRGSSAQIYDGSGVPETGFVYTSTVEELTESGFLSHRYVESTKKTRSLVRLDSQGTPVDDGAYGFYGEAELRGIEYPREYFTAHGLTGEITYFEGWEESVFQQTGADWELKDPDTGRLRRRYPAVVAQALYELLQLEEGDLLRVGIEVADPGAGFGETRTLYSDLTVVGTHEGDMATLFLPVDSLRRLSGVDLKYDRVVLTVDPAKNRQLDEFRDLVTATIAGGGTVPIMAIYWDQELRQAIAPMEQVISFMKALYPVTLALAFIVAAGVAILLTLMSAREAAILRVLGNSKTGCRLILCLQTVLVCLVGLIIGHLGAIAMAYLMVPASAAGLALPALGRVGLYLVSAIGGAVGASVAMTAKNPLELLQVKE